MRTIALAAAVTTAAALTASTYAAQSTALWHVVHDLCVVDRRTTGLPAPCTAVDLAGGIALVKDAGGPTGYLVVPTRRITGIEDPALLAPDAPNYWFKAWNARSYMARKAGRDVPRENMALAVNAIAGRSQAQLHIHIDCVQPEVKAALASAHHRLGRRWTSLKLLGHEYHVRTLADDDLRTTDPFRMLAERDPDVATAMGNQTLALIGAQFSGGRPGFYVLTATAGAGFQGHGEELLDHRCAILRNDQPAG